MGLAKDSYLPTILDAVRQHRIDNYEDPKFLLTPCWMKESLRIDGVTKVYGLPYGCRHDVAEVEL